LNLLSSSGAIRAKLDRGILMGDRKAGYWVERAVEVVLLDVVSVVLAVNVGVVVTLWMPLSSLLPLSCK
jgi:hypothetical protein